MVFKSSRQRRCVMAKMRTDDRGKIMDLPPLPPHKLVKLRIGEMSASTRAMHEKMRKELGWDKETYYLLKGSKELVRGARK